ncbi:MAG: exonuclease domain-containing protein [Candidatus Hodgkinia cicadicola]
MIRELIIDTETTGLNVKVDRIIELAAIELIDGKRTGNDFHCYFNPWPVKVSRGAFLIHDISNYFLRDKPRFGGSAKQFLELVKGHTLIAHNAKFDSQIISFELQRCGEPSILNENWCDTLKLAKKMYPGRSNSLTNLCKRLKITVGNGPHGALRDCELLIEAYEAMLTEIRRNIL